MARIQSVEAYVEPPDMVDHVSDILRGDHGVFGLRFTDQDAPSTPIGLTVIGEPNRIILDHHDSTGLRIIEQEATENRRQAMARGLSLFALNRLGIPLDRQSSRDDLSTLSAYVGDRPQIGIDPSKWIVENPFMADLCREHPKYGNLVRFLDNERGLFLKVGNYPNQRAYWNSTLNGGLPVVRKADPIHEGAFMLHDLLHFVPTDPLLGNGDPQMMRSAYIAHRQLSEASTLVLADMVGVADARLDEKGYDTNKRKIFPVYQSIRESSGAVPDTEKLLAANAYFCFTGDTQGFESLGASSEALQAFKEKYAAIFRDDFLWNLQNFEAMLYERLSNPLMDSYYEWISTDTPLPTLDGTMQTVVSARGEIDISKMLSLFRADFNQALNYQESINHTDRSRLAWQKYFAGQRVMFARHGERVAMGQEQARFDVLYRQLQSASSPEQMEQIASALNDICDQYIDKLADAGELLPHEISTYRFAVPFYPVRFVNYEKSDPNNADNSKATLQEFVGANRASLGSLLDIARP